MTLTELQNTLDCTVAEAEKFNTILDFCKKFNANALDDAINLAHQHNFSIYLDNVLKFMLTDLIDNLTNVIYKDTHILLSIYDFTIAIDTDNILSNHDNIVLLYEDDNEEIYTWLDNNCNGFVEY